MDSGTFCLSVQQLLSSAGDALFALQHFHILHALQAGRRARAKDKKSIIVEPDPPTLSSLPRTSPWLLPTLSSQSYSTWPHPHPLVTLLLPSNENSLSKEEGENSEYTSRRLCHNKTKFLPLTEMVKEFIAECLRFPTTQLLDLSLLRIISAHSIGDLKQSHGCKYSYTLLTTNLRLQPSLLS